jgi:hypothetical protein
VPNSISNPSFITIGDIQINSAHIVYTQLVRDEARNRILVEVVTAAIEIDMRTQTVRNQTFEFEDARALAFLEQIGGSEPLSTARHEQLERERDEAVARATKAETKLAEVTRKLRGLLSVETPT